MPFPRCLVVKKGSKIRPMNSLSIPSPVSLTVKATYLPGGSSPYSSSGSSSIVTSSRVTSSTPPVCSMACAELVQRFMRIWWIWVGSAITMLSAAWSACRISRVAGSDARRNLIASLMIGPRVMATFVTSVWRLKARICRIRLLARSPALRISSRYFVMSSPRA